MENNKLLAEYLGIKVIIINPKNTHSLRPGIYLPDSSDEWQPHKNWNQLMLVVDKIEEEWKIKVPFMLYIFENLNPDSKYKYGAGFTDLHCEKFGDTKIEAVYNACVEYIKTKS